MANTLRFKRGLVSGIPNGALGEPLFTTDTFDLYIGNGTTNTRFQKYIASGTTSQLLRGDGSLLTMPIVLTSPANGQVLKYNGTSWVNDSDSGITGSGTTNFIPKFTGATTLGNSNITDDGTTVSLISRALSGTSASFSGNVNADDYNMAAWKALDWAGSAMYIGGVSASQWTAIDLYTSGTFKARLDASGNLGLGVTPSAWSSVVPAFQIGSGGSFLAGRSANPEIYLGTNARFNGTNWLYQTTNTATYYAQDTGRHIWYQAPSGTAGNAITFTQAMTLTANGRLLLGTTTEGTQTFQLSGNSRIFGTAAMPLLVERTTAASNIGIEYKNATNSWFAGQADNGNFSISTLITLSLGELQIARTGSVGIGTNSPTSRLDVIQSGGTAGISVSGGINPQLRATDGTIAAKVQAITGLAAYIGTETNHQLRLIVNNSPLVYLFTSTNVSVGSSSDSGEKLQVNGTMKVTGASTFGGLVTISGSATTLMQITSTGSAAYIGMGDSSGSIVYLGSDDGSFLVQTPGSSFSNKLVINSAGAATFSSTVTGASFIPTSSTIPTNGMYLPSTNSLGFATNGSLDMTINSRGDIGVGVTPSTWSLGKSIEINNAGQGITSLQLGDTFVMNGVYYNTSQLRYANSDYDISLYRQYRGKHSWYYAPQGTIGNTVTFDVPMTLETTGNLLLGSTTDDTVNRLQVTGSGKFSSSVTSTQFNLSALNTAPATSSSTGTLGEIRIDADHIYVCTATNTWKRVAISTF